MNIAVDLGVATYLAKQIPRESHEQSSKLAWNSMGLGLALSAGVMFIGALGVMFLVEDPATSTVFFIVLFLVPLQALFLRTSASLRGVQDMSPIAWADGLGRCLTVVVIAWMLLTGHGVQAVCLAAVLGAAVTLLVSGIAFRRRFDFFLPISVATWRVLTLGGLPFLVWQASLQIYGQIDILILSILSTHSAVGWYAAAYRLISVPIFAPTIIGAAAFPAISSAAAVQDWSRVATLTRTALRACLVITVPMSFGMAALSDRIVDALHYPGDFTNMVPLISILALHVPIVGVTIVIASCLNAMERQWSWVKIGVAAAVLNPLLNFPLVSLAERHYDNGAIGAAIVTVLTEAFMLAGGLALIPKSILGRASLQSSIRTLLAGCLMVGVMLPLRDVPLIGVILIGSSAYVGSCFFWEVITMAECRSLGMQLMRRASSKTNATNRHADTNQELVSTPPA